MNSVVFVTSQSKLFLMVFGEPTVPGAGAHEYLIKLTLYE